MIKAPDASIFPNSVRCADPAEAHRRAVRLVKDFEDALASQTRALKPRGVLYWDQDGVVPTLSASSATSQTRFRSEAFYARRFFDEYWFVLQVEVEPMGFSHKIKAIPRSKNPFAVMFVLVIPVLVLLWVTGLTGLVALLIPIFAGYCWLDQSLTGGATTEWLMDKERGERRRAGRMGDYLPFVIHAFQEARARNEEATEPLATETTTPVRGTQTRPPVERNDSDYGWERE